MTRGQIYGSEASATQKPTPSSKEIDSECRVGHNRRFNHWPVAAKITTLPKSVATNAINKARTEMTAPTTDGKSSKQRNTPTDKAIDHTTPMTPTRRLVN